MVWSSDRAATSSQGMGKCIAWSCVVGALWCFGMLTSVARAQTLVDAGVLTVRIMTADGQPVVAAEALLQARGRVDKVVRSDSTGVAVLLGLEPGLWALTIRRVGFKPVSHDIRIAAGRNDYTVVATPSALTLAGVRVIGGAVYSTRLEGFERRRLAGTASAVVTHEQIEKLEPIATSRMLRGIGGLRIADSSGAIVAISTRGSKPTANIKDPGFAMVQCVMRVAVDGTIMPPLFSIDQLIPKDVHGIEVFNGPARIPPEFSGLRTDNWCGLIAVWTRDR
jgi:hypothetical protein